MAVCEYFDRFWETTLDNFAILAAAEAEADTRKPAPGATKTERPDRGRADNK
jgi:hypothetical protein